MTTSHIDSAVKATIDQWLIAMNEAAGRGDGETVAELARLIQQKIEEERRWAREQEWQWEYGSDDNDDVHPMRREFK
jgi:hypothetical protein